MYSNTLQLNWKVGHGMPLTPVANNLHTSTSVTGQNVGSMSNIPSLANVMSSMSRQGNVTDRKLNKKTNGKRSLGGNDNVANKNIRNNSSMINNSSRGSAIGSCTQGNITIQEKNTTGKKNKNKSYTLRACSIQKRLETEHRTKLPRKRGPKPRPKTAPMSKYRRKTANLRERQRMGEINVAFEILREKLPSPISLKNGGKCEKLTKINILHIAINYIRAMENLLETGDSGVNSFKEMTKNPIRDDQDRKMEVQKVLEALMKRADNMSSRSNSAVNLKRLSSSRNGGSNRNKNNDKGNGRKRKHTIKNRKPTDDSPTNIPDGVLRDRPDNNENFDTAKAMSFLLSKIGSSYNDLDTDIEKEDEKSSGTSDDEDDDNGHSGMSFENMIMLPEWSELSSTLDISSLGHDKKSEVANSSTSMPNIFLTDEEKVGKEPMIQKEEVSSSFSRFSAYENANIVLDGSCTNSSNINTTVDITNSTISTRTDVKQSSHSLLLELMPIPQSTIKKQQDINVHQPPIQSATFQSSSQVNKSQVVNQVASAPSFLCSSVISMSPNSSNCSLTSHSSNSSLSSSSSSTINSPISPSISLFKEPDPLFASVALEKTPKYEIKQSEQMMHGTINPNNQHVKLETRTTANSYSCNIDPSFQQQHQQLISNSVTKENNNHLLSGNIGVNTGDDIMMRDFTDFVEMVDSLNGMPDIEFVEDNFEIFPS